MRIVSRCVAFMGGRSLFLVILFAGALALTNWATLLISHATLTRRYAEELPSYQLIEQGDQPVSVLCPGEILPVRLSIRLTRAPTVLFIISTIQRNGVEVASGGPVQWSAPTETGTVTRAVQIEVPRFLTAGQYEAVLAVSELQDSPDVLIVPFVIGEECQ